MKLNVLIVGSGGREHALAWKINQSPLLNKLYVAPGNGGTQKIAENVFIDTTDFDKLVQFAKEKKIDLTIVGPDDPLALGIVDVFQKEGLKIFGPKKTAARIEASKSFSKNLMAKYAVPTAEFKVFSDYKKAQEYVEKKGAPIVVKASGLALGKGVFVCQTFEEARDALEEIMEKNTFGEAGKEVIIEEYLEGQEVSFHAICDGKNYILLPTAQDHKPIFDNDKGPNTGGMGTFAPVPWVKKELIIKVENEVIKPTLEGLKKENSGFNGLLYPGLKITINGPKVLEFNARFGDPETQSYIRLIKSDLLEILKAAQEGNLDNVSLEINPGFACCVVLASEGYPGEYIKGDIIEGLEEAEKDRDVIVFHAGTKFNCNNYLTNDGRVLGVTATGNSLQEALDKTYKAIEKIHFRGMRYRRDIGKKAFVYDKI